MTIEKITVFEDTELTDEEVLFLEKAGKIQGSTDTEFYHLDTYLVDSMCEHEELERLISNAEDSVYIAVRYRGDMSL